MGIRIVRLGVWVFCLCHPATRFVCEAIEGRAVRVRCHCACATLDQSERRIRSLADGEWWHALAVRTVGCRASIKPGGLG